MAAQTSKVTTTETSTRELKTTDITVSMRHIAVHVDALRNNNEKDSKQGNKKAYVNELYRVIIGGTSMLEDVAYIMRAKGISVPEDLIEGLTSTQEEAKTRVFHAFAKTDFDIVNKIRYYLNSTHQQNIEELFTKEALQLQFNVISQCLADAFAAQLLFSEAASKEA